MPLIQVKLIENVTWVVKEESRSGEWGIGGQAMTTQAVHALAAAGSK